MKLDVGGQVDSGHSAPTNLTFDRVAIPEGIQH
jgi:hypothetical protein